MSESEKRIWFGYEPDDVDDFTTCEACAAPSAACAMLYRAFCVRCARDLATRILADTPAQVEGA